MRLPVVTLLLGLAGCHPLVGYIPKDLPKDAPLVVTSESAWPKSDVEVHTDDLGIPHIYGQSEPDVGYALGVMHGRDRQFQIYLYVHAAEGRLTEVLGKDLLEVDRENRLLTYRLDEQLAALAPRDKEMIDAYCAGLNAGAAMVGQSAEMAILGVAWEPLTSRNILSVVRLQQWDQSVGFAEEAARHRLIRELGRESPVAVSLLIDTPSGGVPVVAQSEHDGVSFVPPTVAPMDAAAPAATSSLRGRERTLDERVALQDDIAAMFTQGGMGASNSWSVAPSKTAKGVAVLANDPHLMHSAPGVFYMVDLHVGAATLSGGSFPGIPAVLIGHGNDIAWGITNAYADTQDVVIIARDPTNANNYLVDGESIPFGVVEHSFRLGQEKDAEVSKDKWRTTIFGPVLPPRYGSYGDVPSVVVEGEDLAVQWTAQAFPADNARLVSAFWDLAKAKTPEEATGPIQDFSAPSMSVNMAFTNGSIAYRLSGIIPVRAAGVRADLPKAGVTRAIAWTARLAANEKPQATNPEKGYIVASNQRIVENDVSSQAFVGFEGARPWRAKRIDERLKEQLAKGKPSTADLYSIQQDAMSGEAREIAAVVGAHCPKSVEGHSESRVKSFCDAVSSFNGAYETDATVLPFARLHRELLMQILRAHLSEKLASDLMGESWARMAMHEIMKAEHAGTQSPLLDDPKTKEREGLDGFVARATKPALDAVVAEAGGSVGDWRWGKLHHLSLRGALSRAPGIGFLFETTPREQAGTSDAPRAEAPDFDKKMRVRFGAGLRLIAEMTTPPTVRMINDSGNSGHFGSRHLEDQAPLWHTGDARVLAFSKDEATKKHEGAMILKPRRAS